MSQQDKIMEALSAIHGMMQAKMAVVDEVKANLEGATDNEKRLALVFAKELPYLDAVLGVLMEAAGIQEDQVPEGTTIQ